MKWKRLSKPCALSTTRWRHTFSSLAATTRTLSDTKSGKRREMNARLSFNTACELGFRGSLDEWERLMGAAARTAPDSPNNADIMRMNEHHIRAPLLIL